MLFRKLLVGVFIAGLVHSVAFAEMTTTTTEGRKVILYEDGTWKYSDKTVKNTPKADASRKQLLTSNEKISILRGKAFVLYDPSIWVNLKESKPGRFTLTHRDGDAYAVVIAERAQLTLNGLRGIVLQSGREVALDYHVEEEKESSVNGINQLFMMTAGTMQGMSFVFLGNYYAGDFGAVQIITYTAKNLLGDYQKDMQVFLGGLRFNQQ